MNNSQAATAGLQSFRYLLHSFAETGIIKIRFYRAVNKSSRLSSAQFSRRPVVTLKLKTFKELIIVSQNWSPQRRFLFDFSQSDSELDFPRSSASSAFKAEKVAGRFKISASSSRESGLLVVDGTGIRLAVSRCWLLIQKSSSLYLLFQGPAFSKVCRLFTCHRWFVPDC